jgi:DNA modification methylase
LEFFSFPTVQAYKGKHPCEKPLAMMEHIVRTSTRPGAVVLDCFAGSGTTGVACARLGRQFIGIEKNSKYFDIARQRLERELPQGRLPLELDTHNHGSLAKEARDGVDEAEECNTVENGWTTNPLARYTGDW